MSENKEVAVCEEVDVVADDESTRFIGQMIQTMLSPVVEAMAGFMKQNTEAVERLAALQKVQTDRIEALEKQIRLNTLVTPTQVRYFNDAIKKRSRELLSGKGFEDDATAVKNLSAAIRKNVNSRYGIAALHEIPKHEYPVVMQQISTWNDMLLVRDTIKAARKRAESADNV